MRMMDIIEVKMMKKMFFVVLLLLVPIFGQNECEGKCYSNEEVLNIANTIKENQSEIDSQKQIIEIDKEINEKLESNIYMYIEKSKNDSLLMDLKYQQIDVLNQRVILFEERLKVVEPKWYENRYLWFFMGIAITVTAVDLAGQINQEIYKWLRNLQKVV